jgi:alkanesulfonate monooxygenase SsuD/methylene tetrahydromethanopterin reductase-like flavin-dependent oxidoreductase (luciferase family)
MVDISNSFGFLLPTRGVLVYANGGIPDVELNFRMAEEVERLGYDSVWVGDSITSKPRLEALTMMGAIAARTSRVKLGSAVLLSALRHPVHLAHVVSTVDNISAGRVLLGIGAGRGDNPMYVKEHAAVGVPIKERAERMEEGIVVMRNLWTQPSVTNLGKYYPLDDVALEPKPIQGLVPLWISSNLVKRGLWRVAKFADAWISNVPSSDTYRECWNQIKEHGMQLGRDVSAITKCLYISVNINDKEEAIKEGGSFMMDYYGRPYESVSSQLLCVFGPPSEVVETIQRYRDKGADYFIVRFASPDQPAQLAKFTENVLQKLS